MLIRLAGAALRAIAVAVLVMLPAFILSETSLSALEFTRILATIGAVFIIYEYGFPTPSVLEFRFAAPYNRMRFLLMLALILTPAFLISNMLDGNVLNGILTKVARNGFTLMDYPYSPVTIVASTLSGNNDAMYEIIGHSIALNVVIAISCVLAFCGAIFLNLWKFGGGDFNLWLNMPTYKSYDMNSLQKRLISSSYASLLIACLIPLFGPTAVDISIIWFTQDGLLSPLAISWVIAMWCYLPAIYFMRAMALAKIAINYGYKETLVTI